MYDLESQYQNLGFFYSIQGYVWNEGKGKEGRGER